MVGTGGSGTVGLEEGGEGMKTVVMMAALLVALTGCSDTTSETITQPVAPAAAKPDPNADLVAFIKDQSDSVGPIKAEQLMFDEKGESITAPLFFVELVLKKDFDRGGAQDWNSLASAVDVIAKPVLGRADVARLRIKVVNAEGVDWAYVDLRRAVARTPAWKDGTYLEHFALADVSSPVPQAGDALCAFYEKYESARPAKGVYCPPPAP